MVIVAKMEVIGARKIIFRFSRHRPARRGQYGAAPAWAVLATDGLKPRDHFGASGRAACILLLGSRIAWSEREMGQ